MVLLNLADEPVTDYLLEIDARSICRGTWASAYADGYGETPPIDGPPEAGYGSDVVAWQPVRELPPYSTLVLTLTP